MKRSILLIKVLLTIATALMVLCIAVVPGGASTVLITNESGITADGFIDWGLLGGPGANVGSPTIPIGVSGVSGLTVTASNLGTGGLVRLDQITGFNGNFGPYEELLYSGNAWTEGTSTGPITLQFSSLVAGVGAQIQSNIFGDFTATIQAFNAADVLLGSYSLAGHSSAQVDAAEDSAIFIGIRSDSVDIAKIIFGVPDTSSPQDFVINGPRVQASVPEPSTILLLGSGLIGLVGYGRRRMKK